jgi:CheY-like chemotaxis protein
MPRLLVVDDSEDFQEALQMMLEDEGFDVSSALDGKRGLELTRRLCPDVILLDMMMPEMDGLEFLTLLAALPSPPPVVAQSGFHNLRDEALRRGARGFLAKPFSTVTLVGALRAAIESRPFTPELVVANATEVGRAREHALEESARAIERLGVIDAGVRDGLRRIPRWLTGYFGFGAAMVVLLHGRGLRVEAIDGARGGLHEGLSFSREDVYCDEVIAAGSTIVLTDPARHPCEHIARHKQAEAGWNFYSGVPLRIPKGPAIGTVCIVDMTAREFLSEDMRALEVMGRGAGRALETGRWPVGPDGALERDAVEPFIDCASARLGRGDGSAAAVMIEPCAPVPRGPGLAVFHLDDRRMLLLWSGHAGAWSTRASAGGHVLAEVDLSRVQDGAKARAELRAFCL